MQNRPVPEYVDPRKIFAQERKIEGSIPVSSLKQLLGYLNDGGGEIKVVIEFGLDDRKRKMITGQVDANINMVCQRCLESVQIELTETFNLAMLVSEEKIKNIPREIDPWICLDEKLSILDIVEEQLILCLPIVASHEQGKCSANTNYSIENERIEYENPASEEQLNPFAVLKQFEKNHTD